MAFGDIETAPAPALNPLAFVTSCTALAAFDLAKLTNHPAHYRDAAEKLASALRRERAMRVAASVGEPAQAPSPRPRRTTAPKSDPADLSAPLGSIPRAKACAGAYVVRWADGSETTLSGVVHHRDKPATRWAAAFQAADRLRRLRMRHSYAEGLDMGAGLLHGRWEIVGGVRRERADWWRLVQITPMAALVSITTEDGETFEAPEGTAYGAGDPEAAAVLEAALTQARHPLIEVRHPGELASMRLEAVETFGALDSAAAVEPATAKEGDGLAGADPRDLDGVDVVISPRQAAFVRACHRACTDDLPEDSDATAAAYGRRDYAARAQIDRTRLGAGDWDRLDAWRLKAEQLAKHAFSAGGLVRFKAKAGPGAFWLDLVASDGRRVTLDTRRGEVALLARAA
jgi:hypothetical protein